MNQINSKKIILLVGNYNWDWYEEACCDALESLGYEVHRYGWFNLKLLKKGFIFLIILMNKIK